MNVDYLIVGSGLTGATIARILADAGREVLVLEKRSHLGGNVHDHVHDSGIRIHTYGPHYFRTGSEEIWHFVNRFDSFFHYEACLKSLVDRRLENWPISASYISRVVGDNWTPAFSGLPTNFEEASLAMMPRVIYEKFVRYTEKQWGVPATTLSAKLARRFDVRSDDEPRLMRHKYQGIPKNGYAYLMQRMLAGISTVLNCDYFEKRQEFCVRKYVVFTGPIDQYFQYRFGPLLYRTQIRNHVYYPETEWVLPCGQVNNPMPEEGLHIRTLEWKHMMMPDDASSIRGTVITTETPSDATSPNESEYPFPDEANQLVFEKYKTLAAGERMVRICGRLGEYKYLDMDQAIGNAMKHARVLLNESHVS